MPPRKPGPDPDQTTPNLPVLASSAKVWETGVAPNDTRIPGTRRLWLAGALALAVVSSCVTALMLQEADGDNATRSGQDRTTSAGEQLPDLTLPEPPPASTDAPDGKSGLSEPQGDEGKSTGGNGDNGDKGSSDSSKDSESDSSSDSSDDKQQGGTKPTPKPSQTKSPAKPPATSTNWKSVRSLNYPDRYWHLRSGVVQLDSVSSRSGSETKEDSSYKVVSGLANSSCYSFRMTDGRYLRHQNFVLRAGGNDGSRLFKQDATFCPRSYYSGDTVMLESVNYPGYYLRHRNFTVRLERYQHDRLYMADSTFKLVTAFSS
ncbi:AbfB domain-containing protein [Streptomyces sp. NPDC002643]